MTATKTSFWSAFRLRMQLFRIWFMKNILVWIQVALIVCVICMLTGNITATTPFFGKIIYPIFQPLVDEIVLIVEDKKIDRINGFFCGIYFNFNIYWFIYVKIKKNSTIRY